MLHVHSYVSCQWTEVIAVPYMLICRYVYPLAVGLIGAFPSLDVEGWSIMSRATAELHGIVILVRLLPDGDGMTDMIVAVYPATSSFLGVCTRQVIQPLITTVVETYWHQA